MSVLPAWISVDEHGNPIDQQCTHLGEVMASLEEATSECMDCIVEGSTWVNLRQCLTCGGTRCCDNSPRRHATGHHHASGHPLIRSAQPGETWGWCYPEELVLVPAEG